MTPATPRRWQRALPRGAVHYFPPGYGGPARGLVLRGDEWYEFDPDTGLITEISRVPGFTDRARCGRLELDGFPYAERGYAMGS